MSDFLDGLIQRSLATSVELRPRTPSLYEPIVLAPLTARHQPEQPLDAPPPPVQTFSESSLQSPAAGNTLHPLPPPEVSPLNTPQMGRLPGQVPQPDVALGATPHIEFNSDQLLNRLSRLASSLSQPPTDKPSSSCTIPSSSESLALPTNSSRAVSSAKPVVASTEQKTYRPAPDVSTQTPKLIERTITREIVERSAVSHFIQDHPRNAPIASAPSVAEKPSTVAMRSVPPLAQIARQALPSAKVPKVSVPLAPQEPKGSSAPTVTVSIGRVEIRSAEPPSQAPVKSVQQKVSRVMSLDQYMALRSQGALS